MTTQRDIATWNHARRRPSLASMDSCSCANLSEVMEENDYSDVERQLNQQMSSADYLSEHDYRPSYYYIAGGDKVENNCPTDCLSYDESNVYQPQHHSNSLLSHAPYGRSNSLSMMMFGRRSSTGSANGGGGALTETAQILKSPSHKKSPNTVLADLFSTNGNSSSSSLAERSVNSKKISYQKLEASSLAMSIQLDHDYSHGEEIQRQAFLNKSSDHTQQCDSEYKKSSTKTNIQYDDDNDGVESEVETMFILPPSVDDEEGEEVWDLTGGACTQQQQEERYLSHHTQTQQPQQEKLLPCSSNLAPVVQSEKSNTIEMVYNFGSCFSEVSRPGCSHGSCNDIDSERDEEYGDSTKNNIPALDLSDYGEYSEGEVASIEPDNIEDDEGDKESWRKPNEINEPQKSIFRIKACRARSQPPSARQAMFEQRHERRENSLVSLTEASEMVAESSTALIPPTMRDSSAIILPSNPSLKIQQIRSSPACLKDFRNIYGDCSSHHHRLEIDIDGEQDKPDLDETNSGTTNRYDDPSVVTAASSLSGRREALKDFRLAYAMGGITTSSNHNIKRKDFYSTSQVSDCSSSLFTETDDDEEVHYIGGLTMAVSNRLMQTWGNWGRSQSHRRNSSESSSSRSITSNDASSNTSPAPLRLAEMSAILTDSQRSTSSCSSKQRSSFPLPLPFQRRRQKRKEVPLVHIQAPPDIQSWDTDDTSIVLIDDIIRTANREDCVKESTHLVDGDRDRQKREHLNFSLDASAPASRASRRSSSQPKGKKDERVRTIEKVIKDGNGRSEKKKKKNHSKRTKGEWDSPRKPKSSRRTLKQRPRKPHQTSKPCDDYTEGDDFDHHEAPATTSRSNNHPRKLKSKQKKRIIAEKPPKAEAKGCRERIDTKNISPKQSSLDVHFSYNRASWSVEESIIYFAPHDRPFDMFRKHASYERQHKNDNTTFLNLLDDRDDSARREMVTTRNSLDMVANYDIDEASADDWYRLQEVLRRDESEMADGYDGVSPSVDDSLSRLSAAHRSKCRFWFSKLYFSTVDVNDVLNKKQGRSKSYRTEFALPQLSHFYELPLVKTYKIKPHTSGDYSLSFYDSNHNSITETTRSVTSSYSSLMPDDRSRHSNASTRRHTSKGDKEHTMRGLEAFFCSDVIDNVRSLHMEKILQVQKVLQMECDIRGDRIKRGLNTMVMKHGHQLLHKKEDWMALSLRKVSLQSSRASRHMAQQLARYDTYEALCAVLSQWKPSRGKKSRPVPSLLVEMRKKKKKKKKQKERRW